METTPGTHRCIPHLPDGEVIGLLGRNGSGKSTLFRIIYGDLSSESRFVKVNQTVLNSLTATRKHLNYLPEHPFLPEALQVGAALRCLGREVLREIREKIRF